MITENAHSENEELKNEMEEKIQENNELQEVTENTETITSDVSENHSSVITVTPDNDIATNITTENVEPTTAETSENLKTEESEQTENLEQHDLEKKFAGLSLEDMLKSMENIINTENASAHYKKFYLLKELAQHEIANEITSKKQEHLEIEGNTEGNFEFLHPSQSQFNQLLTIFREKQDKYHQNQEAEQKKNLEIRKEIIEKLKNLYTQSEVGTNFFKEIRIIKETWGNAGQVPKSDFKLLNNNYFFHLNQFYQMLDMNKEYLEQEHAHNLEKRRNIIQRAQELEQEPSVQKALNELQFLHKLWKEESEPVAEEFREATWLEFKEISNKIHARKSELTEQIEAEQNANLEKKNQIIAAIEKLCNPTDEKAQHNYWQNAIKEVEKLREGFIKTGSVPRKISNQNWNDFKVALRNFNSHKNNYYKTLKNNQQHHLEEKLKLIEIAKDNMNSSDWETTVPLYKKLQEDWKTIGHVPRNMTNKVWNDFREACNVFFNNYRTSNTESGDNWEENYNQKKTILEELKMVSEQDGSKEKIEELKATWNSIGKVPKDKITINTEFNKLLREKLKLNKINEFDLKENGLSESQMTDKARKIKSQVSDLEAEISKLENNLGFFQKPSRENPLLKDTYENIDQKRAQLDALKSNLHHIISGE